MIQLCHQVIHYDLGRTYHENKSLSEKIKAINNKIKQNKAQYDLDRQTAKTSALSSGNVSKYEFLTWEDVLTEKDLLEKAATMKRFEYSPLGKELKAQTNIAKKQYQTLDDTYEFDKIIKKEKPTFKKYNRSNLIYNSKYSFYENYNINFNSLSLISKYKILFSFYNELDNFYSLKSQEESTKERKVTVYDTASEMYNDCVDAYFDQYMAISDNEKSKLGKKYDPINLFLVDTYNHDDWYKNENEKSTDATRKVINKTLTCQH